MTNDIRLNDLRIETDDSDAVMMAKTDVAFHVTGQVLDGEDVDPEAIAKLEQTIDALIDLLDGDRR